MNLKRIEIENYRGLTTLELKFKPRKPFLLYGKNGTGKSSVFQGLYFGLFGKFAEITSADTRPNIEPHRHVNSPDGSRVRVLLEFSDGNNDHWLERSFDAAGRISTSQSGPEALDHVRSLSKETCFLTRRNFSEMIETVEQDRWERLSPLIGHQAIAKFRGGLGVLKNNLKRDLGITGLERQVNETQQHVRKLGEQKAALERQRLENSGLSLVDELKALVDPSLIVFQTDGSIDWSATNGSLPGRKQEKQIAAQRDRLKNIYAVCTIKRRPNDGVRREKAYSFLDKLCSNNEDVQAKVSRQNFLSASLEIVRTLTNELCPLCKLSEPEWSVITADIQTEQQAVSVFFEEYRCAKQYFGELRQQILAFRNELSNAEGPGEIAEEMEAAQSSFQAMSALLELIAEGLDSGRLYELSHEKIEQYRALNRIAFVCYTEFQKALVAKLGEVDKKWKSTLSGTLRRVSLLREIEEKTKELKSGVKKCKSLNLRLKAVQELYRDIVDFYGKVESAEDELVEQTLSSLESTSQNIFREITSYSQLKPVLRVDRRQGRKRAEFFVENFYGAGEVLARDYLSEANRNALGLSVFFASLLNARTTRSLLVLDDITHSTDRDNRKRLSQFIDSKLSQVLQLFVFTHDERWFNRLHETFKTDCVAMKIRDWNINGVTFEGVPWKSALSAAEDEILVQKVKTGGNSLRQAAEKFIDKICEKYRVEIPFQPQGKHISFDAKRGALDKKIKGLWLESKGIFDPSLTAFKIVKLAQLVTNEASHGSSSDDCDQHDREEALDDFKDWINIFKCKNSNGADICGNLVTSLEKRGGQLPDCRGCGRKFLP